MNRSIYLTTVLGIPIEINISWFIVFFLFSWTLAVSYFPTAIPGYPVLFYWFISITSAILLFMTLLAHELSHSIVAIKNKLPISGITLFIFGGVAHLTKEPQDPATEFKMAAAGPLCSFSLSFIFFILTQLFRNLGVPLPIIAITDYLSAINLMVGLFNLIPGFPLDGGRILRSALWSIFRDLKRATRIASNLGKAFAYSIMGLGFYFIFYGVIISGIWLIFIGYFLLEAASTSYQQVLMKRSLSRSMVKDIMSKSVVTVGENVHLLSLVDDYFFKYRFTSFPVTSHDGTVKGLVTIHDVKDVPRSEWHTKKVNEVMELIREDLLTDANADTFEALAKMAGNGVGRLIVVNGHGKLIGIISQRDVIRLFEVKSDLEGI